MELFLQYGSRRAILISIKRDQSYLGKEITFQRNGQNEKGMAKDISNTGQLQVELEDKKNIWLNSGEISLTSW